MFSAGITAFQLATLLLKLVLGAVALTLACLWMPQKGKALFCIFVGVAFLAGPLLEGVLYVVVLSANYQASNQPWNAGSQGDYRFFMLLMQLIGWAQLVFNFASVVLLVAYAAVRYQANNSQIQKATAANRPSALLLGRRWDTHLPASRLVEIARRREWAHAIDCMPAILFFCLFIWAFGSIIFEHSRSYRDQQQMVWLLGTLVTLLFLAYLLMKDSFGGVSVGKWFTRCRVVDEATGIPASVPQTMLRNAIFLLFPLGSMIELVMANFRSDRKRLGDLWAGTMVVYGPAQIVDGVRVKDDAESEKTDSAPKKHPLDD